MTRSNPKRRGLALVTALLLALPLGLVACHSSETRQSGPYDSITFRVDASHQDILVGETATFMIQSQNTLGRDIEVKWRTTGGDLNVEKGGRVARVTFDTAGTYSVQADLYVDGIVQRSDSKVVLVRPLR